MGSRWAGVDVGGGGGEHWPSPSLGRKLIWVLLRIKTNPSRNTSRPLDLSVDSKFWGSIDRGR